MKDRLDPRRCSSMHHLLMAWNKMRQNLFWIFCFFYTCAGSWAAWQWGQLWDSLRLLLYRCCTAGQSRDWADAGTGLSYEVPHTDCWCQLEQPVKCECSIFFPLKDQRPYLPRIKQSWGENNKFQWEMDVKTDEGGSEGLKNTTLAEGKVSQMVGKRLGFHWKGFNSCESEKDAVILSDMESVPGERN